MILKIIMRYRAKRVGFFLISGRFGSVTEKRSRAVGGFGSDRSVDIFDQVFTDTLFTIGYFQPCRVFLGMLGISGS